jgi:hypothetical protein
MVLRRDNVVKAKLVSQDPLLQGVIICLLGWAHVWRLQQEKNPEFHR